MMTEHSLSSFFPFLWTLTSSRTIKKGREKRSQYPAILIEQALSIKDLLFSKRFRFILKELRIKNDIVLPRRSCL